MANRFRHGYALLIGVSENAVARWALPDVEKDVTALAQVLTHPERCAYPPDHVKTLLGPEATRNGILDGLDWLQAQIEQDGSDNATAILYFSGHGWQDASQESARYYLIPYDVREDRLRSSALRSEDFAEAVAALTPRRLLVILDCCHAGGIDAKELGALPAGYTPKALEPTRFVTDAETGAASPEDGEAGAQGKGLSALGVGAGRAVLSSSQGDQRSYMRRDGAMSIFTYHLIEALTGHAQPAAGATEVLVSDVMSYVTRTVPRSAWEQARAVQTPDFRVTGNFPVALLLGGKGLDATTPPPDPLQPLPPGATVIDSGGDVYNVHMSDIGSDSQIAIGNNIQQSKGERRRNE
ncbi:MAG: caspase family protein [Caldilineae bacterium]|nr:MAG: caspase family protein [Caldilineae bacterium]